MGLNVFGTESRITCGFINGAVLLAWLLVGILVPARAADLKNEGEDIVQSTCVGCHRIQGAPMSRSTKEAPDLIWAGNKYQRAWLVAWLENPKEKLYPVGYDFKFKRKGRHFALSPGEAEQVADFLSTLKDARITEGIMKPGTPDEIARGEQLYREHACQNCHWTPADNRRGYTGGASSTSLVNMGNRLQADWVYRFNLNPDDFVPQSGAYIPNPALSEKDIYAITAYMMTFK
jgi:mono/diheme cytochrome c family protein